MASIFSFCTHYTRGLPDHTPELTPGTIADYIEYAAQDPAAMGRLNFSVICEAMGSLHVPKFLAPEVLSNCVARAHVGTTFLPRQIATSTGSKMVPKGLLYIDTQMPEERALYAAFSSEAKINTLGTTCIEDLNMRGSRYKKVVNALTRGGFIDEQGYCGCVISNTVHVARVSRYSLSEANTKDIMKAHASDMVLDRQQYPALRRLKRRSQCMLFGSGSVLLPGVLSSFEVMQRMFSVSRGYERWYNQLTSSQRAKLRLAARMDNYKRSQSNPRIIDPSVPSRGDRSNRRRDRGRIHALCRMQLECAMSDWKTAFPTWPVNDFKPVAARGAASADNSTFD